MKMPPLEQMPIFGSQQALRKTRDTFYCLVSARLAEGALSVVSTCAQSHRGNSFDDAGAATCSVHYRSVRRAAKAFFSLQSFQRERFDNRRSTVDARPPLLDSAGSRLQCSFKDLLPYDDFRALARRIAAARLGTAILVDKRVKKLASAYTQLFDPSLVAHITIDEANDDGMAGIGTISRLRGLVENHRHMVDFLRLFVSLCSSEKPVEDAPALSQHIVEIVDLATTRVDGVRVPFNAPRRAALFTLAMTGTEDVHVETFARIYDSYLTGNARAANFGKTFAQAMQGLQKSLPFLHIVKLKPNHRTVRGLSLASAVPVRELEEWLRGRRQKIDPLMHGLSS